MMKEERKEQKKIEKNRKDKGRGKKRKRKKMNECWQRVANHYPFWSINYLIGASFQITTIVNV